MITVQVGDLTRNPRNVVAGREEPGRFEAFFGSRSWLAIFQAAGERNLSAAETANELLDFYGTQLGRIGYPYVEHSVRVMRNSRNVALYRLVLAAKHERAVDFFRKIEVIDPMGQRRLF